MRNHTTLLVHEDNILYSYSLLNQPHINFLLKLLNIAVTNIFFCVLIVGRRDRSVRVYCNTVPASAIDPRISLLKLYM